MRADAVVSFEVFSCGEEALEGAAEPAHDVSPEHAAGCAAFMVESFRAFAAATELATRLQLLVAEAKLGSLAGFAAVAAVASSVVEQYVHEAGAALRFRAAWMADSLRAVGGNAPPRERLLFKA